LTTPLHHVNQLYLHLPALGGFLAGQAAAGEEVQRLARLEEARALYRETVEVVAAAKDTVAIEPIRPEADPLGRRRRPGRPSEGARAEVQAEGFDLSPGPVVDVRI
jgi:hypothetical protein